jgi:FAD/FMN-containing dehydrogenase
MPELSTISSADLHATLDRAGFDGRVITPEDARYDEARAVFYRSKDRRPSLIARPAGADDVSRVVTLARETGLELAVRSGGHSLAGHSTSEGGIVLDLSEMTDLTIDVESRTAWAQTGLTAGEYTAAAGVHGLATGFGDTGSVGIGGLVTADGQLLRIDADTHPDLF